MSYCPMLRCDPLLCWRPGWWSFRVGERNATINRPAHLNLREDVFLKTHSEKKSGGNFFWNNNGKPPGFAWVLGSHGSDQSGSPAFAAGFGLDDQRAAGDGWP